MRPLLIAFEGLDGVGKSSLAQAIASRFSFGLLRTPPTDLRAERAAVDAVLAPSPIATQLFYAGTVALVSHQLGELRARGAGAVVDRYWASTQAYARCRSACLELAEVARGLVSADVTVYVELDEAARCARLAERGCTRADVESLATAARLRVAYEAALDGPWSGRVVRHRNDGAFDASVDALASVLRSIAVG